MRTEPVSPLVAEWSEWLPFPDPRKGSLLIAPIGPGAFELRLGSTREGIMLATAKSVSGRISALLPVEIAPVRRETGSRRQYLAGNVEDLEYRVLGACSRAEARRLLLQPRRNDFRFGTDL